MASCHTPYWCARETASDVLGGGPVASHHPVERSSEIRRRLRRRDDEDTRETTKEALWKFRSEWLRETLIEKGHTATAGRQRISVPAASRQALLEDACGADAPAGSS